MKGKPTTLGRGLAVSMAVALALSSIGSAAGCSSDDGSEAEASSEGSITFVWLPDNSSADMTSSREAVAEIVEEATGRDVEIMTTTDYNVAIEAIASGAAQVAFLGPEGYVQANEENGAVQAAFTYSGEDGGLGEACYYSRICVRDEDAWEYVDGDSYSIGNIEGKSFSFVSATSTSGFTVPSTVIVEAFGLESSDALLEDGAFFSDVMFGDSHQGSVVNLLSGQCDVAAFDDVDVDMYLDLVEGEENEAGAVYEVREDAEAPLDSERGERFTVIDSEPVLNSPFCYNTDELSEEDREAITEAFCSDETAENEEIFADPDDEDASALFTKDSDEVHFVEVGDSWYDAIRELD